MLGQRRQRQEAMEAAEETGTDPAIVAAGASVVLSWYYFFVRGDREMGLFVGLWPPTFLAFASYFNQTQMARQIEDATGSSDIARSVRRMMQGQ